MGHAIDQVAGIVEHVDHAVAIAIVGLFLGAHAEEQPWPRHPGTVGDKPVGDARGLHAGGILTIRGQPERRRERADPAEHLRVLPADAECAQRT